MITKIISMTFFSFLGYYFGNKKANFLVNRVDVLIEYKEVITKIFYNIKFKKMTREYAIDFAMQGKKIDDSFLTDEDKLLISTTLNDIGNDLLEQELDKLMHSIKMIDLQLEAAKEKLYNDEKLYKTMGFAIGFSISLFLI